MLEVTAAIFINESRQVLIALRKQGKDLAGYWEFPGGKIEPGETPENCLLRELQEEFSIEAEIIAPLMTHTYHYPARPVCIWSFTVRHLAGAFILHDHDALQWINIADLPGCRLAPADIAIAQKLATIA